MRKLQEFKIDGFKGRNAKTDSSDATDHQAQTINNFEISAKGGVLTKCLGYELATDVLGSNYIDANKLAANGGAGDLTEIYNIWEWRVDASTKLIVCSASDGTNDRIWYWDNTNSQWQILDDSVGAHTFTRARFFNRNDAMIIASGTGATNYPLHINYYEARSIFGGTSNQAAGYYDYVNKLDDTLTFTLVTGAEYTSGGDIATDQTLRYYYAVGYDNSQVGNVNFFTSIESTGNDKGFKINLTMTVASGDAVSRRTTSMEVFRAINTSDLSTIFDWGSSYHLLSLNYDNDNMPVYFTGRGVVDTSAKTVAVPSTFSIPVDMYANLYVEIYITEDTKYYKKIVSNTASLITLDDVTSLVNGLTYNYNVISYWYIDGTDYKISYLDMTQSLLQSATEYLNRSSRSVPQYNYKYMITHHNRALYAPIYDVVDGVQYSNWIGVSNINGNGNFEYDVISNIINTDDLGITNITGLGRILDYAIVFSDNDILKINMASGSTFNWALEETLQDVGCVADKSLVYIAGDEFKHSGYYYVSRDGFRVYDGFKSVLLSLPIEDPDDYPIGVTDITEAVSTYNDRLKQWWISFPTDTKTFKYDLRTGEWLDYVLPDEMYAYTLTIDQELLGTDEEKIVVFDNDGSANLTDFDSTNIEPVWKSKVYDMGSSSVEKRLHEVSIRYRSNTPIVFQYYINKGSATDVNGTDPFPAATTMTSTTIGFPIGARGYEFEFGISLDSSDLATNTYLEIDEIKIRYRYRQSERFD